VSDFNQGFVTATALGMLFLIAEMVVMAMGSRRGKRLKVEQEPEPKEGGES